MNDDGTINKLGGKYANLTVMRQESRLSQTLMHRAILRYRRYYTCGWYLGDRCKTTVEPMIKPQWLLWKKWQSLQLMQSKQAN